MARKRHTPEQIIGKLRAFEVHIIAGLRRSCAGEYSENSECHYPLVLRCLRRGLPTFGFNKPLVRRIYDEIGFDMRKIRPGMTARDLALAGGHDYVISMIDNFSS